MYSLHKNRGGGHRTLSTDSPSCLCIENTFEGGVSA